MKQLDLKPTDENIMNTFVKNSIRRNSVVTEFVKTLIYHDNIWSIAIDGKWGSGKTFFVKQCKLILDCLSNKICNNYKEKILKILPEYGIESFQKLEYKTVYFDAWKNDSELDPIVSLSKSIATTAFNTKTKAKSLAIEAGKELVKIAAKEIAKIDIDSILDIFHTEENVEAKFKKELASLIPKNGRLIVFIDELDRCRPTYAVKLLERVQYFFDNENITFVFAINRYELKNTIQKLYGSKFDGDRYLDRFFDLIINLPEPNLHYHYNNIDSSNENEKYFLQYCEDIVKEFKLTLREQNHFISMVNMTGVKSRYTNWNYKFSELGHGYMIADFFIIPYLIAAKIVDSEEFNDFLFNTDGKNFEEFLVSNEKFSEFIFNFNSNELEEAAKTIYKCIFVDTKEKKQIEITSKIFIKNPEKLRTYIMNNISLVSDSSDFND